METALPNFHFHDLHPEPEDFHADVIAGLSRKTRRLSPKFFYDERGSQLFDAITRLPEYYPTRTEIDLLQRHGEDMADMLGNDGLLFELGSGSDTKIRVLLDALQPQTYAPIDISREPLRVSAGAIAEDHPELEVHAICTDYSKPLDASRCRRGEAAVRLLPRFQHRQLRSRPGLRSAPAHRRNHRSRGPAADRCRPQESPVAPACRLQRQRRASPRSST